MKEGNQQEGAHKEMLRGNNMDGREKQNIKLKKSSDFMVSAQNQNGKHTLQNDSSAFSYLSMV